MAKEVRKKLEVSALTNDEAAATILGEIERLIRDYITQKGLRRMVKVKGGK